MSKTILFITGGNAGLGLEAIKALCRSSKPYEILMGCRDLNKGAAAIKTVQTEYPNTSSTLSPIQADVESDQSIQAAYDTISSKYGRMDVLINNAGANFDVEYRDGKLSMRDFLNKSWDVNVSGNYVLTNTFVPLLLKSQDPRLIFVASGTSSLTNTLNFEHPAMARINASPAAGWPKPTEVNPITGYRSVKAGLNMIVREWSRMLKEDGVKVFAVSPGFLRTGLANIGEEKLKQMGAIDPVIGAEFMRDVVEGKRDADDGKIVASYGLQPW